MIEPVVPNRLVLADKKVSGVERSLDDTERKINEILAYLRAPAVISSYKPTDPRYYGASGLEADVADDVSDAVSSAASYDKELYLAPGTIFGVRNVRIGGHYYPQPPDFGSRYVRKYKVHGGGALTQVAGVVAATEDKRAVLTFDRMDSLVVDDIEIHGNSAEQTAFNRGVHCIDVNYSLFKKLLIHQCSGTGIVFVVVSNLSDENNLEACEIIFCGGFGAYFESCGDHSLIGNHFDYNRLSGLGAYGCYTISLLGNHMLSNFEDGAIIQDSRDCVIGSGNMFRENKKNGLSLTNPNGADGRHKLGDSISLWNGISTGSGTRLYDGLSISDVPNVKIQGFTSSDAGAVTNPYYPVNNTSRQRYGIRAHNAQNLRLLGGGFSPNYTANYSFTGTTNGRAFEVEGIPDGAF